jgi:hypothetical protein
MGFLGLAIVALGYPILDGILGLGYSDKIDFSPQSLIDILGESNFQWINKIPINLVQQGLLYLIKLPLFLLLFGISIVFFLIHFVWPEKV